MCFIIFWPQAFPYSFFLCYSKRIFVSIVLNLKLELNLFNSAVSPKIVELLKFSEGEEGVLVRKFCKDFRSGKHGMYFLTCNLRPCRYVEGVSAHATTLLPISLYRRFPINDYLQRNSFTVWNFSYVLRQRLRVLWKIYFHLTHTHTHNSTKCKQNRKL